MPIRLDLHNNTSNISTSPGTGTIADKRLELLIKEEEKNRISADEHLQEEIDEIVQKLGARYLDIVENENGSVDISILDEHEQVLDTKRINLTKKLIKEVSLDYINSRIIFTHYDNSTSYCDISAIRTAINNEVERATRAEGQLSTLINNEISRALQAEANLHGEIVAEQERAEQAESGLEEEIDWLRENKADLVDGKVPVEELPDDIHDILDFDSMDEFPEEGEWGKLYIDNSTGYGYIYKDEEYQRKTINKPIEPFDTKQEIPNDELGLYKYTEEVDGIEQTSHVVEVQRQYHEGGSLVFNKITDSNNTQLNQNTFLQQFDEQLSNFIDSIDETTNVYSLYYNAIDYRGIRIGTKNVGRLTINTETFCTLTFYKYFSYNASSGTYTYDANSAVILDGNTYQFTDDTSPVVLVLDGTTHTIESNGSGGRIILASLEFETPPYSTYDKKELARVEEVEALDTKVESYKTEIDGRLDIDEENISNNTREIARVESKIGPVQIYKVSRSLPTASADFLDKIFRLNGEYYQCVQVGDSGVHKEFVLNVDGTTEVTIDNYEHFLHDIRNEFDDYLTIPTHEEGEEEPQTVLDADKLFRNNGSIKLGSSGSTGYVQFENISEYEITSLKIGVKAYSSSKPSCVSINAEEYQEILITDNIEETLITVTPDPDSFYIESLDSYTEDEQVTYCDKRLVVTRFIIDFDYPEYEWQKIISPDVISWAESIKDYIYYEENDDYIQINKYVYVDSTVSTNLIKVPDITSIVDGDEIAFFQPLDGEAGNVPIVKDTEDGFVYHDILGDLDTERQDREDADEQIRLDVNDSVLSYSATMDILTST